MTTPRHSLFIATCSVPCHSNERGPLEVETTADSKSGLIPRAAVQAPASAAVACSARRHSSPQWHHTDLSSRRGRCCTTSRRSAHRAERLRPCPDLPACSQVKVRGCGLCIFVIPAPPSVLRKRRRASTRPAGRLRVPESAHVPARGGTAPRPRACPRSALAMCARASPFDPRLATGPRLRFDPGCEPRQGSEPTTGPSRRAAAG